MLLSNPCGGTGPSDRRARFVLYVEGPSDSQILRSWARLVSPALSRLLAESSVILGGRRPARAVEHFAGVVADGAAARGVCVLDRDGHAGEAGGDAPEGLEFFTWPRRHIESYLLVPRAMRRCMRMPAEDPRLAELLLDLPRESAEADLRELDAKRLLAARSALARELGVFLSPSHIARCMSRGDLHDDVVALLERLRALAGLRDSRRVRRRAGVR